VADRPRILVVTGHLPYPPVSGGRLREFELFSRLARENDLHLVAISKTPDEDRANAPQLDAIFETVEVFEADGASADLTCHVARHRSSRAARHIRGALDRGGFDLAHAEGFYVIQHLAGSPVPIVLVEQNVEFNLVRQQEGASLRYHTSRRAELQAWSAATVCAAVTEEDALLMEESLLGLDVCVVPDGVDHLGAPLDAQGEPAANEILFVGNFAYQPNVDAAHFFVTEILPRMPHSNLRLVGNDPPPEVRALAGPRVTVTGRVKSVRPYLERATVVVCPLRIGGGVKVKMLEALRFAKAVVSTTVGAQGLGDGSGTAFRVADEPATFAAEVGRILENPRHRRQLERAAAAYAGTLPTWDDAAEALRGCWEKCLKTAGRVATRAT
jgi:glycosyltransferase involved in cell wall biosynthesis